MSYLAMKDEQGKDEARIEWIRQALDELHLDKETKEKFIQWHIGTPSVLILFFQKTRQLIQGGRKHFGAKCIMESIRFDYAVKAKDDFKVNNNYTAYCARLFAKRYPEYADFFEYRTVRGLHGKGSTGA